MSFEYRKAELTSNENRDNFISTASAKMIRRLDRSSVGAYKFSLEYIGPTWQKLFATTRLFLLVQMLFSLHFALKTILDPIICLGLCFQMTGVHVFRSVRALYSSHMDFSQSFESVQAIAS